MPLPEGLARFNRRVSNKLTRPFAARLPWFGVLHHSGRVTGRGYSTPLMAWRQGSTVLVALTYGSEVDWLKNALSASSRMTLDGESFEVGAPEPVDKDQGFARVPTIVAMALRALDVTEFVEFPIL